MSKEAEDQERNDTAVRTTRVSSDELTVDGANQTRPVGKRPAEADASDGSVETSQGSADSEGDPDEQKVRYRCTRCGSKVPSDFHFCGVCGYDISGSSREINQRDPLIGVVVADRYRLLGKIGTGGMGSVYKVEHVRMGKIMAMKLLHGNLSRDESMIRRFSREARAVSRLTSPNTVTVFDYGQSDGLVYLVMEFLPGKDLGRVITDHGPLSLSNTVRIIKQISHSLTEAHELGIVHRDLKPENIFLVTAKDGTETIKVVDFGLAKLREREEVSVATERGSLLGTPYYMAPEQIMGEHLDYRADIYSLGALTYKMLTGKPPFESRNPMAVLSKHLHGEIPHIADIRPELVVVDDIIAKALAKKPEHRYPNVAQYAQLMEYAMDQRLEAAENADFPMTVSIPSRLVPQAISMDLDQISTRSDWAKFENKLQRRRFLTLAPIFAILFGAAYLLYWGIIEKNFFGELTVEEEPNDNLPEANAISAGVPIKGSIGPPAPGKNADVDVFSIKIEQESMMMVEITGINGMDIVLEVFDQNADERIVMNASGVSGGEVIPNLRVLPPSAYIRVREFSVHGVVPKSMPDEQYTLRVDLTHITSDLEVEPNDDRKGAVQGYFETPMFGYLSMPTDVDYFRLPPLTNFPCSLRIEVTGLPRVDLVLGLENDRGEVIVEQQRGQYGEGEVIDDLVIKANHPLLYEPLFVRVSSKDGSSLEKYKLVISYVRIESIRND